MKNQCLWATDKLKTTTSMVAFVCGRCGCALSISRERLLSAYGGDILRMFDDTSECGTSVCNKSIPFVQSN